VPFHVHDISPIKKKAGTCLCVREIERQNSIFQQMMLHGKVALAFNIELSAREGASILLQLQRSKRPCIGIVAECVSPPQKAD
jgi:hypothetical protein